MIFVVVGCPDHILERIDIDFLGQFDNPEHVFNIVLMIGPLLMGFAKKFFTHRKYPKNGHI